VGGYVLTLVADRPVGDEHTGTNDVATWQQRVAREPGSTEALLGLGYAYQEEERFDEAIETYDEVVAADPANLGALYNRGLCLLEVDEPTAAEESFTAVLAVSPEHALAAKALGEQYRVTERYLLIAAAVEAAADAHPEMADLQALMGLAHEHAGNKDAAIAEYREALGRDPDSVLAREGLARLGVSADE
jgi:tetratricopeptide (TPR) repeat protein